ncbi:Hypothetical Protein FCC1311_087242 [Hondaea fermentalgiana]|uniref:Uncharacterized protein n=1 Tax=Hondaea fermentalgiana TaxID=2315210 RepID=A0A2R5GQB3_9STRA|nr:Hypothetical Protein FCC1311_087242 [Hondaea fermentalgiana]|eukprot:GBG32499.1 Hypothetical Protein FCC1311_087242 [Hondaea fermentalgiana]
MLRKVSWALRREEEDPDLRRDRALASSRRAVALASARMASVVVGTKLVDVDVVALRLLPLLEILGLLATLLDEEKDS